ncbi:MAG: rhomboid family intramembrane serine protease [Flavobacteriales bacterium]|nr:rhomboid family intramembrane serine protease [Flavobacteriales bacterium]
MRITYNAPVTLTFSLLCIIVLLADKASGGSINTLFTTYPQFNPVNPLDYFRLFSHTMGHAGFDHILGNLAFILLLGPILEERYGSKLLLIMILITAIATAVINTIFFSNGILGASGIVFLFIILSSFVNVRENEIPLTFIAIVLLYLGKELYNSFFADNISQFGHIMGGLCGSVFGFIFNKR